MTTPPTDTRAALDDAIDANTAAAIADAGALGAPETWAAAVAAAGALDRAITAHVEAEVARRLAAAPDVEAAIRDYGFAASSRSGTGDERDALRAAIAADKARAVDLDAIALAADLIGRHLAPTSDVARGVVVRLEAMLAGKPARPTPDEARRLVEAHRNAAADVARCGALHASGPGTEELQAECDAEAALLRALGVE